MSEQSSEYLLGTNQSEFNRLQFQHGVWQSNTNAFFDRLGVAHGWNCLDVGAGPGFVSFNLRERVGESGSVTALEPSTMFLQWLSHQIKQEKWENVFVVNGTAENANLPQ
ncbi:MAG: methyltransferase domain-containing protein, partial [Bacteroidetes bacterium]|nr:methyltransferase domain-containing protein [Bacteroidota bacterium]